MMRTKICTKCGKEFPATLEFFRKDSRRKENLGCQCKDCQKEYYREYIKNSEKLKESFRRKRLKHEYRISIEEYDILLESQSGVCAICGKEETAKDKHGNPKRLSVDHDHETGKIRGLLCHRCNVGVGMLGTVELLNRAKDYIKENENGED